MIIFIGLLSAQGLGATYIKVFPQTQWNAAGWTNVSHTATVAANAWGIPMFAGSGNGVQVGLPRLCRIEARHAMVRVGEVENQVELILAGGPGESDVTATGLPGAVLPRVTFGVLPVYEQSSTS